MIFAPIVLSIKNFVVLASSSPFLPDALTAHFKTLLQDHSDGILSSLLEWKMPWYLMSSLLGGKCWMKLDFVKALRPGRERDKRHTIPNA
jgi:hypothetical protein